MNVKSRKHQRKHHRQQLTQLNYVKAFVSGTLMGIADIVPGVSGGTVALVMGVYHRLVAALSNFDQQLLRLLTQRDIRAAIRHIDLIFLFTLGAGVVLGLGVSVMTISKLLSDMSTRPWVMAAFFGLVLGSIWIVLNMIRHAPSPIASRNDTKGSQILWFPFLIGLVVAAIIGLMSPNRDGGGITLWYVFVCAAVAICAMILPGISGAMILLLLGVYEHVVDALKSLLHFENIGQNLIVVSVFVLGCILGLLGFSKLLRRLLDQQFAATMSVMCGLMAGSLVRLWAFPR
ncbi:MAG TPA: DUF368 domain-containing protein [Pirellulaceae bacterium]|nr:DUF368 domain-containing protein [Pirellulaceae bacterium]